MHTIRSRYRTYYTGSTADGKQVLLGWHSDFIAVLLFDETGKLLETKAYPLGIDLKLGLGPAVEVKARKKIQVIMRELHYRRGPIRVKPFFIESWQVGLRLFPIDLEEFLADPDRFAEDEAQIYKTDIDRWKANQNCILQWGNNYYLDRDGNTI